MTSEDKYMLFKSWDSGKNALASDQNESAEPSSDCMNSSGENSPNFPDIMEKLRETLRLSGGGSTFWPALCDEHKHGLIKKDS